MAPKARSKTTKQKEQKERMRRRREEEKMKSMQETNLDSKTEQYQNEYQKSKSEQNSKQYQNEYQKSKSVQYQKSKSEQYQKSKSEQYQKSKSEQYQNEYQNECQKSKSEQYQNEYQKSKSEQFQNKCQTEVEIDLSEGVEIDLSFKADLTDVSKLNVSVSEDIVNRNCQIEGCLNSEFRSSFYVQGSFHQGSTRFGINAGKQCVGNCLAAVIHGEAKSIHEWRPIDLDTVLIEGNDIYTLIHGNHLYLCVEDLPDYVEIGNKLVHCNKMGSITAFIGEVDVHFEGALPLDQALQYALTDSDNCFVTVRATTSVIIRQHQKLYLFDSHAKNSLGLIDAYGSSILLEFSDIHAVYQHFCKYVQNNKSVPFDVTGMKVSIQDVGEMNELSLIDNSLGITNEIDENEIEAHSEQGHVIENLDEAELIKDGKMTLNDGLSSQEIISSVHKSRVDTGSYCIQNETFSDVEIEGISNEELFNFKPTVMKLRVQLCRIMKVPMTQVSKGGNYTSVLNMGSPLKTKSIQGDGNCLFRAISYAVSQKQEYHSKIRAAIVQHMLFHKDRFMSFTSPFSVEEHIASNKMKDNNSWGTAVEIIAAADLLQTDIFTYTDGKWIKYSAHQIKPDCNVNDKAIYLKHYGNHYEVVTDVGQKCLDGDCISGKNRKRKVELEYPAVAKKSKAGRQKEKYNTNPEFKESILLKRKEKYAREKENQNVLKRKLADKYTKDEDYRESLKERTKLKYKSDETCRTNKKDASVKKYASEETHRENTKNASVNKYAFDESHRQSLKDSSAYRYASDETHRQQKKNTSVNKYCTDEVHRQKVKYHSINKYATDETHKQKVKYDSINKYATDESHKQKVKYDSINKYATDETHKQKVKYDSINKYATDETHKQKVKYDSINKYATDETHKQKVKYESVNKYATDETHRQKVKCESINKYATDEGHKEKIKEQNRERCCKNKEKFKNFDNVIDRFRLQAKKGPDHVCACCFRLLFDNQVLVCNETVYLNKGDNIGDLAKKCISHCYLHVCTTECSSLCRFKDTNRTRLWICYTCHRKLLNGQLPAECHANNLDLEAVPAELEDLNNLEQHLVALHIPFMKVLGLPKGGQKGVHGPVVCVPSNLKKITSCLPRSEDESNMLPVKLKRKISYKGYEEYQYISTKRLEVALSFLMKHNRWYSNTSLDKEWLNPIPEQTNDDEENEQNNIKETSDVLEALSEKEYSCNEKNENKSFNSFEGINAHVDLANSETCLSEADISDSYLNDGLRGVQLDTCLQPADIGQEILDQCFDEVFNISPAEGNKPVSVLKEEGIEAKSFPVHYPSGKNTLREERDYKLSLLRYFNLRLMSVDNRFAKDASYIFFAQYVSELDRVISNVQIALRKESPVTSDGKRVTSSMLCNKDCLKDLLKNDQATKYLKPVRGTPPYWQSTQKDIFAMIRQLGIPTFFCSFSSADFRWTEMTEIIMKQQGDIRNVEDLDWKDKCKVLNSNPVTLARMFEHRFHVFLHDVILSNAEPIGKVVDYFFRVEFQQRGSPHVHCLFWVEGAPKFGEDDDAEVVQFVDQYITCEIPDKEEDPELNEMVTSLHQHSKNHSKSCKKKGTVCRFNFPRPPSTRTFIAKQKDLDDDVESEVNHAKQRLSEFWDCILDKANEGMSTKDVLDKVNMTQVEFEDVASLLSKRSTVVLRREVNAIFINHYNSHLLRTWNANMDIQYVLDAYACVVYIISYISKAERELCLLLQQTKVEAQEGNLNAQQTMRKIGTAYLHHREISAQEAVFRVIGLKLKQCSRKVEFVPVGENPCRMSIPLKQLEASSRKSKSNRNDDDDDDDESVWMTSRVDRFKERPKTDQFEQMCLARFCSDYDVLAKSQVPQKINKETTFQLGKDLGYIRKRTRTKPAVIRYPRFSVEASPEKYYQCIIQLFLPYHHDQQLKPPQFKTYEEFYNSGFVKYSDSEETIRVKNIVESNKSEFVRDEQALENAERDLEEIRCPENAWGSLCPEAEVERHECNMEGRTSTVVEDDITEEAIPDLNKPDITVTTNLLSTAIFPRNEIVPLLRTMNKKQRKVFYRIRDWCLQKAQGKNVKPFHVFITGGGGTGKSHLIKCLYYEMTRILSRTTENPDEQTVLLTAPTGTAAFNISGSTIHSALGIFKNLSFDHVLLSEDKINTLRSKLDSLQVLVIDEISMVNKKMLFFIHQRLRQIKKMPEDCLFGGVSVVAVGDFYQLPPVKSRISDKLYVDDPSNPLNHLWFNLFEIVELDEIMRQRGDSQFSEILNRLRVRSKQDPIEKKDLCAIKQCIREGPENALHIYATNAEVNSHNNEMVMKLDTEVKLVEAADFIKDKTSGRLIKKKSTFSEKDIQLPSSLLLAVGSRVMLIKNIDTKDGLVNGVMGTVMEINQSGTNMPERIFIHFDNCKVGRNVQVKKSIAGNVCIGLEPSTEDIPKKNGSRKQFPLHLSWGCTIHKVQGMTVQECVVDLTKCFCYGQAYVALSRVTSLNGLYLKDVVEDTLKAKIYCDPDVVDGISKMRPFLNDSIEVNMNKTTVLYHNIEGLRNHIEDLKVNVDSSNIDFVCLTETWMNDSQNCNLEGYQLRHLSRYEAYDSSNEFYSSLKDMNHGGVGVFIKKESSFEEVIVPCQNLECYAFRIPSCNLIVVTVYRTQKYELQRFLKTFSEYIERVLSVSGKVIVCGDFNQDIRKGESDIENYMKSKGFVQSVQSATTELGTLIDHVYIKGLCNVSVSVLPTYYRYHEAICIQLDF